MFQMNWMAVIGAALAGFLIGGVWYGPLFSKVWQRESGLSDEAIRNANMAQIFGLTFMLNLFASFILGHVMATYGHPGPHIAAMVGFGIGLGFVASSIGVNYLFARKSLKLFLIDAGYWTLVYTVMGAIFGALG